jgi:hypothetical protein
MASAEIRIQRCEPSGTLKVEGKIVSVLALDQVPSVGIIC